MTKSNTPYTPIAERLADIKSTMKDLQRQMKLLRSARANVRNVTRPLAAAYRAKNLRWTPSVSTELYSNVFHVTVTAHTVELDGFKDKRLLKVLSKFLDADVTQSHDYAESMSRTYVFTYNVGPELRIQARLTAQVKSDSATCQKVLVGTQTRVVEEKQYKIVCSGGMVA